MTDFHVKIGDGASFAKTVSESDVYQFAGITGDFSPVHVNQQYMDRSSYGQRLVHGALVVGLMSTASTMAIAGCRDDEKETPLSVGYDRVRFIAPVKFGDTLTVSYAISEIDLERRRSTGDIRVINQEDTLVAVAKHILQWVPNT